MTPKEEFYKYGESLGIKINDLQRLKMLADNCQEDMANEVEYLKKEIEKIDAKYTQEFDYWQEKAKQMTNKYNDLIKK